MGGGVSKASHLSGSELHHWGDHTTHWCCQGSGIEAFARLADSIYWNSNPAFPHGAAAGTAEEEGMAQLFVLQFISSRLSWREVQCVIEMVAEAPGSRAANEPLQTTIRVLPLRAAEGGGGGGEPTAFVMWVRVPRWAQSASASVAGGLRLDGGDITRKLEAGSMVAVRYAPPPSSAVGSHGLGGQLTLRWSMGLRWEKVADKRPRFQLLQVIRQTPPDTPPSPHLPVPVVTAGASVGPSGPCRAHLRCTRHRGKRELQGCAARGEEATDLFDTHPNGG